MVSRLKLRGKLLLIGLGSLTFLVAILSVLLQLLLSQYFNQRLQMQMARVAATIQFEFELEQSRNERLARSILADPEIQASLSLLFHYLDKQNYNPIIFDVEKESLHKLIRQQVVNQPIDSIRLYDSDGVLVLAQEREAGEEGMREYLVSYEADSRPVLRANQASDRLFKSVEMKVDLQLLPPSRWVKQLVSELRIDHQELLIQSQVPVELRDPLTFEQYFFGVLILEQRLDHEFIEHLGQISGFELNYRLSDGRWLKAESPTLPAQPIPIYRGGIHPLPEAVVPFPTTTDGSETIGFFALPLTATPEGVVVAIRSAEQPLMQERESAALALGGAVVVALLLVAVVSLWLFNRILTGPLAQLRDSLTLLEHGSYPQLEGQQRQDEIGGLMVHFNSLSRTLKQQHSQIQLLLSSIEQLPVELFITNTQGVIEYVNRHFTRTTGYEPAEAIGQTPALFKSGENQRERYRDLWSTILRGERWSGRLINQDRYGRHRTDRVTVAPVFDEERQISHFVAIREDMSSQEQMQQQISRFRTAIDHSHEAIFIIDPYTLRLQDGNLRAVELLGLHSLEQLLKQRIAALIGSYSDDSFQTMLFQMRVAQGGGLVLESELNTVNGRTIPIELTLRTVILQEEGSEWLVLISARDITERRSYEARLRRDHRFLEALMDSIPDHIFYKDRQGHYIGCNRAFALYLNRSKATIIGSTDRLLLGHELGQPLEQLDQQVLQQCANVQHEAWVNHPDGSRVLLDTLRTPYFGSDGELLGLIGISRDITRRKWMEEENLRRANYDDLTDLPNRHQLHQRLESLIEVALRDGSYGAVLFFDLDNFKVINDSLGHSIGDRLLQLLAERLVAALPTVAMIARIGGDEFVILIRDLDADNDWALQQAHQVADQILQLLQTEFMVNGHALHVSCSIGATLFPLRQSDRSRDILRYADMAMYHAKSSGKAVTRFYTAYMQEMADERLQLESQLRGALASHQFELYYQPQYDEQRQIFGAEVLLRWNHPQIGFISPAKFIPIAEESNLILMIGRFVLESACQQLVEWRRRGQVSERFRLAINVSPHQFTQPDFVAQMEQVIAQTGVAAEQLELELTEGVFVTDAETLIGKMVQLRQMGIIFAIDDFGTGYSSLSYLKRLPVDILKIDQSFVRDIVTDSSDGVIVDTIIAMSHHLKLNVIAEGVETEAALAFLSQKGCHLFQGYYFSKPLPIAAFNRLLEPLNHSEQEGE